MKLFILLCLCLVATMASAQNATIAATTTGGLADVTKTTTGTTGAVVHYPATLAQHMWLIPDILKHVDVLLQHRVQR